MYVRIVRVEGLASDAIDQAPDRFQQQQMPVLRQLQGFAGAAVLADRASGAGLVMSYWANQEALRASEQPLAAGRSKAVQDAGGRVADVDSFEIVFR